MDLLKKDGSVSERSIVKLVEGISRVLKERRTSLGISLRDVAQRAGVSHHMVFKIEEGRFESLNAATLLRLEAVLGLEPGSVIALAKDGASPDAP